MAKKYPIMHIMVLGILALKKDRNSLLFGIYLFILIVLIQT